MQKIQNPDKKLLVAVILMLISNLGWILPLFVIPWLPLTIELRVALASIFVIFGHITYNLGLFIAGSKMISFLRRRKDYNLISVISQIKLLLFISSVRFRYSFFRNKK